MNRLAIATDAKIYVPIYSLVPHATYRTAYQEIASLYSKIYTLMPASKVTIMGDSAGGGLAAGFCEYLGKRGFHSLVTSSYFLLGSILTLQILSLANMRIKMLH